MDPEAVLSKTPREFTIIMQAQVERVFDELEREAQLSIMRANATNASKRIRSTDLFKRPSAGLTDGRTADDIRERQKSVIERLERYEQFNGKF